MEVRYRRRPDEVVLDNGIIILHSELYSSTSEDIVQDLSYLFIKKISPIKIYLSSPGGSIFSGIAIYDYIRLLISEGAEIYTIGQGEVASMGGFLLQAGSVRVMQKNSFLLIHEIDSLSKGKTAQKEEELKFIKRLQNEVILQVLAERSKLTVKEIKRKWFKTDWWLSAKESLELGFVDRVEE